LFSIVVGFIALPIGIRVFKKSYLNSAVPFFAFVIYVFVYEILSNIRPSRDVFSHILFYMLSILIICTLLFFAGLAIKWVKQGKPDK
tara:strand:- start:6603 stop:6863 length:261 start_codon:yes stop_codon:yes gene_type:complete